MCGMMTRVNKLYCIFQISKKLARRTNLKSSDHEKNKFYVQWQMLTGHTVVIIVHCALGVLSHSVTPNSLCPYGLCSPPGSSLCPWDFPGKNAGMGCHFLLQGMFPTQGSNIRLLHWQADSLALSHLGSPFILQYTNIKSLYCTL